MDPRHVRALERIAAAATSELDLVEFWRTCTSVLDTAVPHFESPCWFTLDPGSRLITSHFQEGMPEIPPEWLVREYSEVDYNSLADVLASPTGTGTLHEATGGQPELARKFHDEMQPYGVSQELLTALRTKDGEVWGVAGLYRGTVERLFDEEEVSFMRAAAPYLAEGARRGLLLGEARDPDLPDAPGLLVLDQDIRIQSATPEARRWLAQLPGPADGSDALPPAVLSVAGLALRAASGEPEIGPAMARVRSTSGWCVLHGAAIGDGLISVIIDRAGSDRLAPLLMSAYGLTPREREVTTAVLTGASTAGVARALRISEQTVQQHLKSIFDKTGVRSRHDLVTTVFLGFFEPRVRDNESRAAAGVAARGGPMPSR